jgi:hypothetical protein
MRVSVVTFVAALAAISGVIALATHVQDPRAEVQAAGDQAGASQLVRTVQALRGIHTDSYDTRIPPGASSLLSDLKGQLEQLVSQTLADPGAANASPSDLQDRINNKLKADGVLSPRSGETVVDQNYVDAGYDYGDVYDIAVTQPADYPDLLAVTTSVGVCCGEDTSFYLYRKHPDGWSLALVYSAGGYEEVDGARARFQLGISPPDQVGNFFIVVADVNPWCTSNWQSLRFAVLCVGPSPTSPQVLLRTERTIFLDQEPVYSLEVRRDSFRLRFLDEKFMELLNRGEDVQLNDPRTKRLLEYRVSGSTVTKSIDR